MGDLSVIKSTSFAASSPSRAGSPSPKKTIRDGNTTALEMRSLAESESRGAPRAFKDPPNLQLSTFKVQPGKPTAENLLKLGTTLGASKMSIGGGTVSERGGPKSARSGVSRTSRGEPVDPYKDHTVEQMDELILTATRDINRLMNRKKAFENDPYATKTSIKGKVKPIIEEMTVLRTQLFEYEYKRDAKIPDHEKLPKTCIYYKHYIQVA